MDDIWMSSIECVLQLQNNVSEKWYPTLSPGYFHGFVVRDDIFTPSAQRDGPIYVATHASDLDGAIKKIHSSRKPDLILLQGGLLRRAWLASRDLTESTQVALYASAGDDGRGPRTPGGGTDYIPAPHTHRDGVPKKIFTCLRSVHVVLCVRKGRVEGSGHGR
jgi:hypothetical protein